jgi:hypothetical protein
MAFSTQIVFLLQYFRDALHFASKFEIFLKVLKPISDSTRVGKNQSRFNTFFNDFLPHR